MLFQVTVSVMRMRKDNSTISVQAATGFLDVVNPNPFISVPWVISRAHTARGEVMDESLPMDVNLHLARHTEKWSFDSKLDGFYTEDKYYVRNLRAWTMIQIGVIKLAVPRVQQNPPRPKLAKDMAP